MAAGTSRWSFGTGRESAEHSLARKGLLALILTLLIFETDNKHARCLAACIPAQYRFSHEFQWKT